jgi:hypothetical protein
VDTEALMKALRGELELSDWLVRKELKVKYSL